MIQATDVCKLFKLYKDPKDRLKEIVLRKRYSREFTALKDVSFTVREGETLGIIGENGAGKSTLLKILTGILLPTSGHVAADGRVTGLLELGTGFNTELSGRKNIYMNGMLIGMSREELDDKLLRIIDFAELGDFIEDPLKTYSSGMTMRLAFAVAIHAEPTAFVVDEALSVGDAYFQQKCMRKMQEFKESGGSIVFVSHDMNAVKTLCDSAILLDHGAVKDQGTPKKVVDLYSSLVLQKLHQGDVAFAIEPTLGEDQKSEYPSLKSGSGEIELVSVRLCNEQGEEVSSVISEAPFTIIYEVSALRDLEDPHYGISIRNRFGVSVFNTSTHAMGVKTEPLKKGRRAEVSYEFILNLYPDTYAISLGIANRVCPGGESFEEYIANFYDIGIIQVLQNSDSIKYGGCYNMNPKVTIKQPA